MPVAARTSLLVLLLGPGLACAEGASSSTFGGFPPGPQPTSPPSTSTTGDTEGMPEDGECCVANSTPGCNDVEVEACVCAEVPTCCSDRWTPTCAELVDELGCGQCGGADDTGDVDPDSGGTAQDCCAGGPAPGCDDATVQACVCDEIPFCCDTGWEKVCASAVEALGCGHCGGVGDTGDPDPTTGGDTGEPPPPPGNDCCTPAAAPGCTDVPVQDCVCMQDPYCCDTEWDQVCVDQVDMFGCGTCGGPPPPGPTCCMAQAGPGCGDPIVELCVCLIDSYCCDTLWDDTCAVFADLFMCTSC